MKKYDYLCMISDVTAVMDPFTQKKYELAAKNYLEISHLMQQRKLVAAQIKVLDYGRVNNFYETYIATYGMSGLVAKIDQKYKSENIPAEVDFVAYTKNCICLDRFFIVKTKERKFKSITNKLRKYFEGDSI